MLHETKLSPITYVRPFAVSIAEHVFTMIDAFLSKSTKRKLLLFSCDRNDRYVPYASNLVLLLTFSVRNLINA